MEKNVTSYVISKDTALTVVVRFDITATQALAHDNVRCACILMTCVSIHVGTVYQIVVDAIKA